MSTLNMRKAENTKEVRKFFQNWKLYRKLVENNCLAHRQAYGTLREFLKKRFRKKSFSLIDLGCGDAQFMAAVLRGFSVKRYTGVDITGAALLLAKRNTAGLVCEKKFVLGDFCDEIKRERGADVIWLSLALHHLSFSQKADFFKRCEKACAPGGVLLVFDLTLREAKDRDDFISSWACRHFKALTQKEFLLHKKHVSENDFPEKFSTYAALAAKSGFSRARLLYSGRAGLLKFMVFERKS